MKVSAAGILLLVLLGFSPAPALAHGSVTPEADLCIIRIGYYRAHFKIYLPRSRGHKDYCEDIPAAGETVFVMEYEHSGLGKAPIDFRVIRNTTGLGIFTNLDDVRRIEDIDEITVVHHAAAIQPDVFTVIHNFEEEGEFVGVVNVRNPENGQLYSAVFPFEVGFTGFGWWPWFVAIALLLQIHYLWMGGWFARIKRASEKKNGSSLREPGVRRIVTFVALLAFVAVPVSAHGETDSWLSRAGYFRIGYQSKLEPIVINRIHSWVLHVETPDGTPVTGASIALTGGMPLHNHGLPTEPRMTEDLGDGDYLVEGLRFHMNGDWELRVEIDSGGKRDTVVIPLTI